MLKAKMDCMFRKQEGKPDELIYKVSAPSWGTPMMASADRTNRRILIVDDTTSIHEDFRKILACTDAPGDSLSDAEAALFGTPVSASLEHFFSTRRFRAGRRWTRYR